MTSRARHHPNRYIALALGVALVGALAAALAGAPAAPGGAADADLALIVERYNAALDLATASIDSLRVTQTMTEPQSDGTERTATAVLRYARGGEMERRVLSSNLSYPAGEFTLASLLGPRLDPAEYSMRLEGDEHLEGTPCHRLSVEALRRDVSHLDGTVWVSTASGGPVRIVGAVADPPFPVAEVRLDKRFVPGPLGFAVLRCHVGEVRVGLLLGGRRGTRAITYSRYVVNGKTDG